MTTDYLELRLVHIQLLHWNQLFWVVNLTIQIPAKLLFDSSFFFNHEHTQQLLQQSDRVKQITYDPPHNSEIVSGQRAAFLTCTENNDASLYGEDFARILSQADEGIEVHAPELCGEGQGGAYFMRNREGNRVAVFKPNDEDPQAPNNPKKTGSDAGATSCAGKDGVALKMEEEEEEEDNDVERVRRSIPMGQSALREVAAYAFDRGFAGVPATAFVKVKHPIFSCGEEEKMGSLQQFVDHESASWDVPAHRFDVEDVHRIACFDIRTFNTDRHGGNMLAVRKTNTAAAATTTQADQSKQTSTYSLVPIDHAYAFPVDFSEANWEWLYWPQARKPFSESLLREIDSIDMEEDARLLRSLGLGEEVVRVNRITTLLLKRGAAAGATLFEIASLCRRKRENEVSQLETICAQVQQNAAESASLNNSNQTDLLFWHSLEQAFDGHFSALKKPTMH